MRAGGWLAIAAAVWLVAGVASALQVQLLCDDGSGGYGPYQIGDGGELTMTVVGGSLDLSGYGSVTRGLGGNPLSFQSFCLEHDEYIFPRELLNSVLSRDAVRGGEAVSDPLSQGTGWLYQQFARGMLAGYSYDVSPGATGARQASADLLQLALWQLEGESSGATVLNNIFYAAAVGHFGSEDLARGGSAADYGVYAFNNNAADGALHDGTTRRQDVIYYDGTTRVPDGGLTLAMVGFAIAGVAVLRRRLGVVAREYAENRSTAGATSPLPFNAYE